MNYSFAEFLALLGGIGVFLYGMKVMSEGLQKVAGDRLRSIMGAMTRNKFMGVTTGVLITALIQSSSASTVMVVSFVNAGLMSLEQSMSVILGANLGTTFTTWIVSIFGFKVKMASMCLPLLAVAVPMLFFKNGTVKSLGEFLIGFAFLFLGLEFINQHMPDLTENPEIFATLQHYSSMGFVSLLLFFAVGLVITMIIQSSAATFALVLVMATNGWIPFDMGCAIILGGNVGTSITPLLAALGGNTVAKKAAMGHLVYNLISAAWMLVVFFPFCRMTAWFTQDVVHAGDPEALYKVMSGGGEPTDALVGSISMGLTLYHTLYNILSLLVMIGFTKQLVKIVNWFVKTKKKETEEGFTLKYISGGLLNAAELNISQAQREIVVFAQRVERMLGMVKQLVHTKTGTEEFNKLYTRIGKYEDLSDRMEIEIANYLNKVIDGRLSHDSKMRISTMLNFVGEIESIADSCNNIARTLVRKEEAHAHFGEENYKNIDTMLKYVSEAMANMIAVLADLDDVSEEDLERSYDKEREIDNYRNLLRTENIENINQKKYPYQAGIFYMDIVCEAEKLADFIINVIDGVDAQHKRLGTE